MFQSIVKELKVLARSTPDDKYALVTGLIQMQEVVAVTGDGLVFIIYIYIYVKKKVQMMPLL